MLLPFDDSYSMLLPFDASYSVLLVPVSSAAGAADSGPTKDTATVLRKAVRWAWLVTKVT